MSTLTICWVWRHPQTVDYLLNTHDARFETLAYFARQHRIICIAPSVEGWDYQMQRSGRPISGSFTLLGLNTGGEAGYQRILDVLTELKPDIVVCEGALGGLDAPEWDAVRMATPDAYHACYYGGGPLWGLEGNVPLGASQWDMVFVPHRSQVRALKAGGIPNVMRAWGVPLHIFTPDPPMPKQFHLYYPANFAPGKRNALVAQYLEQYAPQHLPSLFTGNIEHLSVLDMVRVGSIPMNQPGPPRGQAWLGGRVPQVLMPMLYRASEVVVYGSQEEGHPNAIFEAMACGTPAIGMRDCAWYVGEALDDLAEEYDGIYAIDPSPEGIADAIEHIRANYQHGASEARRAIAERYDWWRMYLSIDRGLRNGSALKKAGKDPALLCEDDG